MTSLPTLPIFGFSDDATSADETGAILVFSGPNGTQVPLQCDRATLAQLTSYIAKVHLYVEGKAQALGQAAEIRAIEADIHVQAPIGEASVVLSTLTKEPVLRHYRLDPTQADTLADQIREAAAEARSNKTVPRN
jgi:hypothetical protein